MASDAVLYDSGPAPIRAVLEAHGSALALFARKEQNAIVRDAMQEGGIMWILVFLPKRFTDYAKQFLGYEVSHGWPLVKMSMVRRGVIMTEQPTPLVYIGTTRQTAIEGARCEARATANKATAIIRIPLGHAMRPKTAAVLRRVPAHEVERIASEVEKSIVLGIRGHLQARMDARATAPPAAPRQRAIIPRRSYSPVRVPRG